MIYLKWNHQKRFFTLVQHQYWLQWNDAFWLLTMLSPDSLRQNLDKFDPWSSIFTILSSHLFFHGGILLLSKTGAHIYITIYIYMLRLHVKHVLQFQCHIQFWVPCSTLIVQNMGNSEKLNFCNCMFIR